MKVCVACLSNFQITHWKTKWGSQIPKEWTKFNKMKFNSLSFGLKKNQLHQYTDGGGMAGQQNCRESQIWEGPQKPASPTYTWTIYLFDIPVNYDHNSFLKISIERDHTISWGNSFYFWIIIIINIFSYIKAISVFLSCTCFLFNEIKHNVLFPFLHSHRHLLSWLSLTCIKVVSSCLSAFESPYSSVYSIQLPHSDFFLSIHLTCVIPYSVNSTGSQLLLR